MIDSVRAVVLSAAKNANVFSPLGGLLKEYLTFPVSLTTDSRGTIYITDANGGISGLWLMTAPFSGSSWAWDGARVFFTILPRCAFVKMEKFSLPTEAIVGFKNLPWLNSRTGDANLNRAKLASALWTDDRTCGPGSIGECQ